MSQWAEIRHMHEVAGVPMKEVARRLGLDVKTVRRALERKQARVRWKVARGRANGRPVGVVGWNIPLARPTGLDVDGQRRLGEMLKEQLGSRVET